MIEKNRAQRIFTSESVTEGHPDKICDQIADGILDAFISEDPHARTAIEVTASIGLIHVFGEVSTVAEIDYKKIIRDIIRDIGYEADELSMDGEFYKIQFGINEQSPDISCGVDKPDMGAGDQGMMSGYATNETKEMMPLTAMLAHRLCERLTAARKSGLLPYLKPDGKAQVSIEYNDDHKPIAVRTIVVSAQHDAYVDYQTLRRDLLEHVITKVIPSELLDGVKDIHINPTGRFVLGGPAADSGLTGRKIMVDTYGSMGRHGGGSFSGKDPTKVDRTGAYLARYISKNIVAAGLARECEVQIAYAIGVSKPVSFTISTFGTGFIPDEILTKWIEMLVDMRPARIISAFNLNRPIYRQFAVNGHFGRNKMLLNGEIVDTPWEKLEMVKILKQLSKEYFKMIGADHIE